MRLKCRISLCYMELVFGSGAECTKSSCVLSSSQQRQQSGKSLDYEEPDLVKCTHIRTPHTWYTHTIYVKLSAPALYTQHSDHTVGAAGIAVLLLKETAAAPKHLPSLLLSSHPLIYQLPSAVVSWAPRLAISQPMKLLDGLCCYQSSMELQPCYCLR